MRLRTGDVISCYTPFVWKDPGTWLAPMIRKFTGSKWTHSAMVVECWGSLFVLESFISGVVMKPISEYPDGMIVRVARPKFQVDPKAVAVSALGKVTRSGYDFTSMLRQAQFQLTGKWRGAVEERRAEKKFYCSEFVAWALRLDVWYMLAPVDIAESDSFDVLYEGPDSALRTAEFG